MPSITYNGQSFAVDGRRIWLLGASIQYARVPASLWADRIAAAKQAGFNTIETACPWMVHEPRKGRFTFEGDADLRRFITACAAAGMRLVIRVGPYIGSHFDGGGLPGWLIETPGVQLRQANQLFLEHVSRYFRRLLAEIVDFQASAGGPVLLVQSEHAWTCSNEEQVHPYLHEITRFIRESGITVPIVNANDLWQDSPGTIDTWRGYDDLLVHLRQLRTVQPDAPRLVSAFEAADIAAWGEKPSANLKSQISNLKSPAAVLRRLAEVLAAGAQPIVSPFHAGTNFDFLGGRVPGRQDGFVITSAAIDPPLGEDGTRGAKYHAIRRLITFANHFGHVFAELDPDYQPIVLDPEAMASVVPLRGSQGRIAFVFGENGGAGNSAAMLVLDDGVRLPVNLGDQPVGWFALDVDLQGVGRLDYSNICPWGMVDRQIVVFQGPARAGAFLSIGGTPLDATIPADGAKPVVLMHKGLTVVICNQGQIDATYHDDKAVYVGIGGFDAKGAPLAHAGFAKAWVIRRDAKVQEVVIGDRRSAPSRKVHTASPKSHTANLKSQISNLKSQITNLKPHASNLKSQISNLALQPWQASPATAYVNGQSPRFASLDGPETLSECGAPSGYGWYRVMLDASGRKLCHAPEAADRLHLFLDGVPQGLIGVGAGAQTGPFELRLGKGEQTLVALVDNLGRFSEGNDLAQYKGLWGHIHEVKPLRSIKPKVKDAAPVSPFDIAGRGFISGGALGQMSDTRQAVWTFTHSRKTPILVDVNGAQASGTFVLNDEPIAYYAGATGGCLGRIVIDHKTHSAFKRGKNVLRFAPDPRQENAVRDISKATMLYECVHALTDTGNWAFAKWEPPAAASYKPVDKAQMKAISGLPCWWRTTCEVRGENAGKVSGASGQVSGKANPGTWHLTPGTCLWLDVEGMSKGQAYINGENLGRYFSATGGGRGGGSGRRKGGGGPQTRLYVPWPWIKTGGQPNEIVIFDEHGFDPGLGGVRLLLIH